MGTPDAGLIVAARDGTWFRHLFFVLAHPLGTIYAWDGVGSFVFGGNTYVGLQGLVQIQGVSQTKDIQAHDVLVTLNGVPSSSLQANYSQVRNVAATITAVWIDLSGTTRLSRTVFTGKGDNVRTAISDTSVSVTVRLRSAFSNWNAAPRRYYSQNDQQRTYPSDTGFNFVSALENVTIAGWSKDAETSGDNVTIVNVTAAFGSLGSNYYVRLVGSATLVPIGNHTTGLSIWVDNFALIDSGNVPFSYIEETSLNAAKASAGVVSAGGAPCYVDNLGDVRGIDGNRVWRSGATDRLRKHGTIASVGTAGANTVTTQTQNSIAYCRSSAGAMVFAPDASTELDLRNLVYDNNTGKPAYVSAGVLKTDDGTWVEDVTGNAVSLSGGNLQVSGANVTVSTTGALRTNAGNKIKLTGGSAATQFLRIWT